MVTKRKEKLLKKIENDLERYQKTLIAIEEKTVDLRAQRAEIDEAIKNATATETELLDSLKQGIIDATILLGESVKVEGVQSSAVFYGPSQKVDTKRFLGYAVAHPEVQEFITVSPARAVVRTVGGNGNE